MIQNKFVLAAAVATCFAGTQAYAKASAEDAAKLGGELTPVGAIKAGNADGSIPEWTGGLPQKGGLGDDPPDNPEIKGESPLFTITKENMGEYADALSEGHKKLLGNYPKSYKMNVYKSHRTVGWPKEIYDTTIANATTAVLEGTDAVKNANLGFPFPIPSNGAEVIWNHKVRWRGDNVKRYNNQMIVQADGSSQQTKLIEDVRFMYGSIKKPDSESGMILHYLSEVMEPPRLAGQLLLVYEPMDQTVDVRKAWIYNPGLRRVRRAPNVAYDNPYEGTDGNQFNDQVDMFNGAMDRYTWKLVGKKEMYLPYNSYKIASRDTKYKDMVRPRHLNQELPRYEKHRVWVVDSNLRDGTSHTFSRRTFYVEEDSWTIGMVDCYDNRGGLYKFQESHMGYAQNIQSAGGTPEIIYDFDSGRYFMTALANEDKANDFSVSYDDKYFTTGALKKKARR